MGCQESETEETPNEIMGLIQFQIEQLHNGDAKFYGDFVVTNVGGSMRFYDLEGKLVKEYDTIHVNWLDCDIGARVIIYANASNQLGFLQLDDNLNIVGDGILLESEYLNIDPTICRHPDGTCYVTATEIRGNVNNADKSQENGLYTVKLYKTEDFTHLEYITDIIQEKANIEDGDLNYYDEKWYFSYEKEEIDKGNSAVCVSVSEDKEAAAWSLSTELLKADADHEPAVFWKEGEGYYLYYSCDKDDPGTSYSGAKVYKAEFDEELRLVKETLVSTETQKGILLYDVIMREGKPYFLYARDYLSDCDLVAEYLGAKKQTE